MMDDLKISVDGKIEEIANFNSKWVDCVAAKDGISVCSSVHLSTSGPMIMLNQY